MKRILVYIEGDGCYRIRNGSVYATHRHLNRARRVRVHRAVAYALDPRCTYCRRRIRSFGEATFDHLKPASRGGTYNTGNLKLCCEACNYHKSNFTLREWQDVLETMLDSVRQLRGGAA